MAAPFKIERPHPNLNAFVRALLPAYRAAIAAGYKRSRAVEMAMEKAKRTLEPSRKAA